MWCTHTHGFKNRYSQRTGFGLGFRVLANFGAFYQTRLVPSPGSTGWTGQSGLVFKTVLIPTSFCCKPAFDKCLGISYLRLCYSMGKRCGESVDHLLLHCSIAWELWSLVFCLFGIRWVMPHTVLELFEAWQGKFAWHRQIDVWKLAPHCLIWCIWRERNARSFEGCERSLLEIKSSFLHTLIEWSVVFSHFSCSSFPTFLDRCTFVS